jgi:poly(beta-D-mannuronate) C5 epimerase
MQTALFVRFAARLGLLTLIGSTASVAVPAGPAQATACTGAVRYAATTNTVYLSGRTIFTPTRIAAVCPAAPLRLVNRMAKTWELDADLVVQDGGTLLLRGGSAGGDVNTLRIRSLASNRGTEVQQILARYGTIDIESTRISSWDPVAAGPDTNVELPAIRPVTDRGRAFIRALSILAPDGRTPLRSTMKIRNSRLSYLGYNASESYGVTYKARGCDRDTIRECAALYATGYEIGSTFEHNYIGTYAWGARSMVFRGNTYRENLSYGLDPHDASSRLVIDRNRFTGNGNHGLICSQRCDRLTITGNRADHNGAVHPQVPEVHGIMLHRGVTNTRVTGNLVTDQPTGAGIAIFDSSGDVVSGNTLRKNRYGIRLTVGSSRNIIRDNVISGSLENALLLMPTADRAIYSTRSGRPTENLFRDNVITGTGSAGVKMVDTDGTTITGRSMTELGGPLVFTRTSGTVLAGVGLPSRQPITVTGTVLLPSSLKLGVPRAAVVVDADGQSTVTWR